MDEIINYLLLTIIFVFDPLAIALVIAANFAFAQLQPITRENLYGEEVEVEENIEPTFEIEKEDILEDLVYGQEDIDEKIAEKRMNIIGQNGNDGEHYEEEEVESYAEAGYMKAEQPTLSFSQEAAEINRIMGKDLTEKQMQRLKDSKLTRTFNDDDELKIHY
jgi:hypothetical protein